MNGDKNKSFWALMATQFFGAFNDSVFQIVVALLMVNWIADAGQANKLVSLSGIMFALPFLLFSFLAGRVADRFSKARVMVAAKTFDLLVVGLAIAGMYMKSVPVMLAGLFCLAAQSTFFGPAKYGILPDLKSEKNLPGANALVNVATFVALLMGTIFGTFYAGQFHVVATVMGLMALGSVGGALLIEKIPAANPNQPLLWNPLPDLVNNWRLIRGNRPLRLSLLAVSYFWFVSGVFHLNMLVYVNKVMGLDDKYSGYLLSAIVIGIALGSLLAGKLSQGKVELGIVPVGAAGTALFTFDLYFSHGSFARTLADVFFLGLSSGLYLIPLTTLIQLRSPQEHRGRILATTNFFSFIAIALASGFQWLLGTVLGATPAGVFLGLAFLSLLAMGVIYLYLPQAFVRLVIYLLTNVIYRLNVIGRENVPLNGPALLVPNHVSMADPFFISGALSRLVRFIMFRDMYELPVIHQVVKFMDVIPISENDNPKEIMRSLLAARKKLEEGHIVCIFAEGQISRLGGVMMGFKRGLEIILKGMDHVPVVPVHLEGVWGSIFSFEGKKFIWKRPHRIPYPVTVTFGKPLFAPAPARVRQEVMDLGAAAFSIHRRKDPTLFESFLDQAKAFPKQEIVCDSSGKSLTYHQLSTASALLGQALRKQGLLSPGARLGILLPPSVAGAIVNLAVASQGGVPVNVNYTLAKESVENILKRAGAAHVVTSEKMLEKLGWEKAPHHVLVEALLDGFTPGAKTRMGLATRLLPRFVLRRTFFRDAARRPEDLATLLFTSGSTGDPKGVALSQGNILSNIQSMRMVLPVDSSDAILGILPFFHSFGFMGGLWYPLIAGFKAVYHTNPLDSKTIGDLCQKEKVTFLIGTPTFLSAYLRRIDKEKFQSLRFAVAGAEKLRPELAKAFEEKYGVPVLEGYGCTELSPVVAVNVPDIMDGDLLQVGRKVGKIGRPIPGVSVKIVDPDSGGALPAGQAGLLLVKGPNVMQGYWQDPEKTAEVLKDGWYITGDIATIDEDGFIEITDRLSRFSKIGGEMVPHIKVEQKLQEAAKAVDRLFVVTGVPDEKRGECLVVLAAGFTGDLDQLWKDLNATDLPKLWIPARDKFFTVESLPTLGSGKLDMTQVNRMAKQLLENRSFNRK